MISVFPIGIWLIHPSKSALLTAVSHIINLHHFSHAPGLLPHSPPTCPHTQHAPRKTTLFHIAQKKEYVGYDLPQLSSLPNWSYSYCFCFLLLHLKRILLYFWKKKKIRLFMWYMTPFIYLFNLIFCHFLICSCTNYSKLTALINKKGGNVAVTKKPKIYSGSNTIKVYFLLKEQCWTGE